MLSFVVRRLFFSFFVILGVLTLVFLSMHFAPGDPIDMLISPEGGGRATPELVAQLRAKYGLDQPLHVQYGRYLKSALQLDLGRSIRNDRPVTQELVRLFPATFQLTVASLLVAALIGTTVGILAAVNKGGFLDNASMTVALLGVSLPNFLLGLLLMLLFALHLGWLPPSGREPGFSWQAIKHLIMPATTLGVATAAIIARLVRSSMLDVLKEDYVRTAAAKGVRRVTVIMRHAFRNALTPIVTVLGLEFGVLLSGAVIAESIFAWPGVGRYLILGINGRDFPVVQGTVIFIAVIFVLVNLIVDLLYSVLDPRVQYS